MGDVCCSVNFDQGAESESLCHGFFDHSAYLFFVEVILPDQFPALWTSQHVRLQRRELVQQIPPAFVVCVLETLVFEELLLSLAPAPLTHLEDGDLGGQMDLLNIGGFMPCVL
jgi:hypothetical protein